MKTGLILPNNLWFCPYVNIYVNLLKELSVDYDVISWNRDGVKEDAIQFNYTLKSRRSLSMLWAYLKFARFVRKTVKSNAYDRLIVFTPQAAIFISGFLKRNFKGKYIFDYRDLSIEQNPLFKRRFVGVLSSSYVNVVSSPGFLKYLPEGFEYIQSHNFDISAAIASIGHHAVMKDNNIIDVLTIGGIRDYESNAEIMRSLANIDGVSLRFVGKGPSAADLEELANEIEAENVEFKGYYPKEKEGEYIADSDFMNIYYPRRPSHDTALSNRFYNSLIYKKPMITTADTIQGDYTLKYGVGVAVKDCKDLPKKLKEFLKEMDKAEFEQNCDELMSTFISDYDRWNNVIRTFYRI